MSRVTYRFMGWVCVGIELREEKSRFHMGFVVFFSTSIARGYGCGLYLSSESSLERRDVIRDSCPHGLRKWGMLTELRVRIP